MPYPNFSMQEVRVIAHNAGFRDNDEITATAVAWAESTGKGDAISPPNKDGTRDYGLWQINSSHFGHLSIDNGVFGLFKGTVNEGNVLDPTVNSTAAFKLYEGRGRTFGDWTTYKNGAYKQYVPQVEATEEVQVTGNIPQDIMNEAQKSVTNPILKWLGNIVPTIGFSVLAAVLLILGVAILISESKAGKAITNTAKTVGKVAAVA